MSQQRLHHRIAHRLLCDIVRQRLDRLPPLAELAVRYGTSLVTMHRAARLLRDDGVLSFQRGRGIAVVRDSARGPLGEAQRDNAARRLFAKLSARITGGVVGIGESLPKLSFLAASSHVSQNTVVAAYRMLIESGLVHRRGRRLFVGSGDRPRRTSAGANPPTVLVLLDPLVPWREFRRQERTRAFTDAFCEGAAEAGVVPQPVSATAVATGFSAATGRTEIHALVRSLGPELRGMLVVAARRTFPDLDSWLRWAATRLRIPVVWFDRYDEGIDRMSVRAAVIRCHFSERAGVATAVSALLADGHRTLGVPYHREEDGAGWCEVRTRLIVEEARRVAPGCRLLTQPSLAESSPAFAEGSPNPAELKRRWTALARKGVPFLRPLARRFLENGSLSSDDAFTVHYAQVLVPYLRNRTCTAIIAANDTLARKLYAVLRAADVSVPHDISMVSFDNSLDLDVPVSTVDFGFGHLGYCAIHHILGDIPIRTTRDGDVAPLCRLVEHNSIARPRRHDLKVPLEGLPA